MVLRANEHSSWLAGLMTSKDSAKRGDFLSVPVRGQKKSLGGDPAARSRTATLLRLHPNHQSQLGPLAETSVAINFRGVTGGVYKARERIHRSLLICDY